MAAAAAAAAARNTHMQRFGLFYMATTRGLLLPIPKNNLILSNKTWTLNSLRIQFHSVRLWARPPARRLLRRDQVLVCRDVREVARAACKRRIPTALQFDEERLLVAALDLDVDPRACYKAVFNAQKQR